MCAGSRRIPAAGTSPTSARRYRRLDIRRKSSAASDHNDIYSLSCLLPDVIRQCRDPLLGYAVYFCCHAGTSLLCIAVFSIVDDGEGGY